MFCGSDSPAKSNEFGKGHLPVLLREVLGLFASSDRKTYLDATFGGGGHTRALLESGPTVSVVAIDCDPEAAERAHALSEMFPGRFRFYDLNFSELDRVEEGKFDGVLFDYGVSSYHFDQPGRGFSFRANALPDMRMNPREGETAAEFLETASREDLIRAVKVYGEETSWRRIVDAIIDARGTETLQNTTTLATLISNTIPAPIRRRSKLNPATKTFQGVRIAVNRELDVIEAALPKAFNLLAPDGVLAAISFHSLEDRIVKRYFRKLCGQPIDRKDNTPQQLRTVVAKALTRKPVTASAEEIAQNPRSRSAKLRAVRKLVGLA
ncbi:MAG: 16S rRNA (cytosine(1402)-N(4))-methyltransferase RsmH [Verrucomicrobia bacterium]|nr:16S rRNA (cytosine(1402)-N(4))-methyltransferase RsmH [Verrucomicrobiota bacterium]MDA1066594.1 16S rRNA (cytosine(1402)-N(4))-methyltransferase RsmH [Verrucomicrobiota bacterium]